MKNKLFVRVVAIALALLMALSIIMIAINTLANTASANTQAEIDRLRRERNELAQQRSAVQSEINSLRFEQSSVMARKTVLDNRISLTEAEIDNILEQIAVYYDLIAQKEIEVAEATAREEAQWDLYRMHIREMEESGAVSYVAVLFGANSFIDLLARIDVMNDIMRTDERQYGDYVRAREETQKAKAQLEQLLAEAEEQHVALEEKYAELALELEEALEVIREIEESIEAYNEIQDQYEAEDRRLQAEINAQVEQLRREEEARLAAGGSVVRGTGSFMWPVPSSNVVTSPFGIRNHPVYRQLRMHNGIDIAAPQGVNIVASDTGTVTRAEYSSSYGNYIVISHGNGYTTLYAHLSRMNVRSGQTVTKGQVIGLCGSTGVSTGPHLHFEISRNGSRENPLNYFTSYVRRGW